MAKPRKMTFTLDSDTADRIDRTALQLGMPKSAVVREAVAEYSTRAGRMTEAERVRILAVFDEVVPRIPKRPASEVARELAEIRHARRTGWLRGSARPHK
jgi:hypothetical protein